MGKLGDRRSRHDGFYKRAKGEKFAARSVYKLEEIDRRFRIFRKKQRVLDLGCRPGSWLQFAAEKIGPDGAIVGLDREAIEIELPPHASALIGDVLTITPAELRGEHSCFHVVLSDMAPDTTGIAFTDQTRSAELVLRALDLAETLCCPGGSFVAKILMGESFAEIVERTKRLYQRSKTVRPEATRKSSSEVYVVGTGKRRLPKGAPAH